MKKLIEKKFFDRNTQKGVDRYLSTLGFDLNLGYTLKPGPTKRFVYAVENEAPKPVVAEKKESKPEVKSRMKAAMKRIKKAPRSK